MSLLLQKKISLLFLLIISASLLSSSLAARPSKSLAKEIDANTIYKETSSNKASEEEDKSIIYERLLTATTKDYGKYDPPPALDRPPWKRVPN